MQKQVLVAIEENEVSREVVQIADVWVQNHQANLYFVHATQLFGEGNEIANSEHPVFYEKEKEVLGKKYHDQFRAFLDSLAIESDYQTLHGFGTPASQILAAEQMLQADLIFMAAHNHTMVGRLFLGGNTNHVLHHCHCPLYLHKVSHTPLENKILVPLDYTQANQSLLQQANEWALSTKAELIFIHVIEEAPTIRFHKPNDGSIPNPVSKCSEQLEHYVASLGIQAPVYTVAGKKPHVEILKIQKNLKPRLLMMATHLRPPLEHWLTVRNTDYLLHHVTCPICIYKGTL